MKLATLFDIIS